MVSTERTHRQPTIRERLTGKRSRHLAGQIITHLMLILLGIAFFTAVLLAGQHLG